MDQCRIKVLRAPIEVLRAPTEVLRAPTEVLRAPAKDLRALTKVSRPPTKDLRPPTIVVISSYLFSQELYPTSSTHLLIQKHSQSELLPIHGTKLALIAPGRPLVHFGCETTINICTYIITIEKLPKMK